MTKMITAIALAMAFCAGLALSGGAQAAPLGNSLGKAAQTLNVVEKSAYVYRGRRYCWYGRGWHGAGWYQCGYATRRGYGWGGVSGWNGWVYGAPVVVARPPVVVAPAPYYWRGRHYYHRRWYRGRWVYY
jgi:hypothetical protein